MDKNNSNITARISTGFVLIVLGGLFLLDNYGIINFSLPDFLWHWEYILIGLGTILLITSQNKTAGTILVLVGLLNLFPEFWPLILVALGIYIILKRNGTHHKNINTEQKLDNGEKETNESNQMNSLDDVSIFGGGTKSFTSNNFTGGKLTAIFGGSELHLENCQLAPGKNVLDLFTMFGGYTIYVPQDWDILIDVVPIFGGFSDKRIKDPNRVYEEGKTLIIKGMVLFGGGEVKF